MMLRFFTSLVTRDCLKTRCFICKMKVSLTFVTLLSLFHFQWLHATFRRAEFEFRPFNHLNVTRLLDMFVDDFMDCSFACLHNMLCVSFNVAVNPDDNGKFRCELLPSTSSNNPANLSADPQSHLYQIKVSRKALVKVRSLQTSTIEIRPFISKMDLWK